MIEVDSGDGVIRIRGLGQAGRHPALRILERGDAVPLQRTPHRVASDVRRVLTYGDLQA